MTTTDVTCAPLHRWAVVRRRGTRREACCRLHVACCTLHVVGCTLYVACCMLHIVRCVLHVRPAVGGTQARSSSHRSACCFGRTTWCVNGATARTDLARRHQPHGAARHRTAQHTAQRTRTPCARARARTHTHTHAGRPPIPLRFASSGHSHLAACAGGAALPPPGCAGTGPSDSLARPPTRAPCVPVANRTGHVVAASFGQIDQAAQHIGVLYLTVPGGSRSALSNGTRW